MQLEELDKWGKIGIITAENRYLFGRDYKIPRPESEMSIVARRGHQATGSLDNEDSYGYENDEVDAKTLSNPYNDYLASSNNKA
jgi:hypothetical protein